MSKHEAELLEALRQTVEQLRLLGIVYEFTSGDQEANTEIPTAAEAAIARAEGRESER